MPAPVAGWSSVRCVTLHTAAAAGAPRRAVAFAHELLPRLSLGYNVGAAWESSADRPNRDAFLVYSVVLGVRLTDHLSD